MKLTEHAFKRIEELGLFCYHKCYISTYKRRKYKDLLLSVDDLKEEYKIENIYRVAHYKHTYTHRYCEPICLKQELEEIGINGLIVVHVSESSQFKYERYYILFDSTEDKLIAQLKLC